MKNAKSRSMIVILIVLAILASFAFTSCAKQEAAAPAVEADGDASPFIGDPSETYYMCVMVSGVEYWFPVYEMMKEAAHQLGVKSVYTEHRNMMLTNSLLYLSRFLQRSLQVSFFTR